MASPVVDFSEAPVTEHDADAVVMVVPLVSATTDDEWESLPGLRESLESRFPGCVVFGIRDPIVLVIWIFSLGWGLSRGTSRGCSVGAQWMLSECSVNTQ